MPERQTRDSDGLTIDLPHEEAEQDDIIARARRVLIVNSAGTVVKNNQVEENRTGSECSGSDGATSRVLTLQNTSTSGGPVSVWVEDQIIAQSDVTFSHLSASSTVTFTKEIYDADTIRVRYYI